MTETMSEKDAAQRICPMRLAMPPTGYLGNHRHCVGSQCMAWIRDGEPGYCSMVPRRKAKPKIATVIFPGAHDAHGSMPPTALLGAPGG
jgi:hypothetical protein